jgi:hypothetical protein
VRVYFCFPPIESGIEYARGERRSELEREQVNERISTSISSQPRIVASTCRPRIYGLTLFPRKRIVNQPCYFDKEVFDELEI